MTWEIKKPKKCSYLLHDVIADSRDVVINPEQESVTFITPGTYKIIFDGDKVTITHVKERE